MSEPIKQASIHFQLLIAGTLLFLVVFFWVAIPQSSNSRQIINVTWHSVYGLSAIAGYLAFVVLVAGHVLFRKPNQDDPRDSG